MMVFSGQSPAPLGTGTLHPVSMQPPCVCGHLQRDRLCHKSGHVAWCCIVGIPKKFPSMALVTYTARGTGRLGWGTAAGRCSSGCGTVSGRGTSNRRNVEPPAGPPLEQPPRRSGHPPWECKLPHSPTRQVVLSDVPFGPPIRQS